MIITEDLNNIKESILLYEEVEDIIGKVEYVEHMGSDLTIVNAARVSFGKHKEEIEEKDEKLIKYLIKHKHTSTLEHNIVTFRFTVPLFVRSQHHRHRTWAYNEISRRYTDENLQFYEPKWFRKQHPRNRQASILASNFKIDPILEVNHPESSVPRAVYSSKLIKEHSYSCMQLYDKLLNNLVCKEQARMILPQNLYTQYYGTVNLNNLIKFIKLRTHAGAQWEIQKVAFACLDIAKSLWPITINSLSETLTDQGTI